MRRVVFRTDASYEIGAGHVMRCLTLATYLAAKGAECHFLCRDHPGNLIQFITDKGFSVHTLSYRPDLIDIDAVGAGLKHAAWLGTSVQEDLNQSKEILQKLKTDWVIVDHYALDVRWESGIRNDCFKVGVIDDLHDRVHDCDLLIDQTLGLTPDVYSELVPGFCKILVGADYAILRPEFSQLRQCSLERRDVSSEIKTLLVNMGGVDIDNVTGRVLEGVEVSALSDDCKVIVVLGSTSPHVEKLKKQALSTNRDTSIIVNASNMAELMSMADLAIGASGSTTWERCCLGLPTVMVVLAENQRYIAEQMSKDNIADVVFEVNAQFETLIAKQLSGFTPEKLNLYSRMSRNVTDGNGADNVTSHILS